MKYKISQTDDLLDRLRNGLGCRLIYQLGDRLWNRLMDRLGFRLWDRLRNRLQNRLNRYEV
jgi:hypothetical protein